MVNGHKNRLVQLTFVSQGNFPLIIIAFEAIFNS